MKHRKSGHGTTFARSMSRVRTAAAIGALIGAVLAAVPGAPSTASASGITTHAFMAHRAIPFVDDGVLRDLLASHTDEVLAGAHFPDAGYGSSSFPGGDFGEVTHWERFVNAHAAHLRGRADCAPLRDPSGPCASQVAHLMGIAAHGMGDEMWDWLFEPQMADYGESPVHPLYRAGLPGSAELASVPPGSLINTPEFAMDNIALAEYGRLARVPVYPPPVDDLLATYAALGRGDITREGIYAGHALITAALSGERAGLAAEYPRVKATMPRSSAAYLDGAGGVLDTAEGIAGYYENLWRKLTEPGHPAPRVVSVNPEPGTRDVKLDWLPVRAAPGPNGGGARDRIIAVLANSLDPATVTARSFLLLDEDDAPVPPAAGFPRPGPYGAGDGTHSMMFYPAADLAPCTRYTAVVTPDLRDHAGEGLRKTYSWSFTTRAADGAEKPCRGRGAKPGPGGGHATVRTGRQRLETRVVATADGHRHALVSGAAVALRDGALRRGRLSIRVSCLGPGPCHGVLGATSVTGGAFRSLGAPRFAIPEFATRAVTVTLPPAQTGGAGAVRIDVSARVLSAGGPGARTQRSFTVSR